jgi:hypothetical protein
VQAGRKSAGEERMSNDVNTTEFKIAKVNITFDAAASYHQDIDPEVIRSYVEMAIKPLPFVYKNLKVSVENRDAITFSTTAQREWQGLTDEDRQELAAKQYGWEGLCSAVEAKLREKNCAPNI